MEEAESDHIRARDVRLDRAVIAITGVALTAGLIGAFGPFVPPETQKWALQLVTAIASGGVSFLSGRWSKEREMKDKP